MSEKAAIESPNKLSKNVTWPPNEDQIRSIASSALNQSRDKDVKLLVYWENDPTLMIFNPFQFADTDYIRKKYETNGRSVEVNIGRVD